MSTEGSITCWLDGIKEGSSAATEALWQRCYPTLVRLAREKLRGVPRGMADEDDVALSAMDSFCHAAQLGRFPNLADRDDLWRLLLRLTARKAADLARREKRQRRGGGRVQGESAVTGPGSGSENEGFAAVAGDGPTPEFAALMAEQCQRLLELLEDPDLQAIAVAKMQGYSNEEIARQHGCSQRTVERRLKLIRDKWRHESDEPDQPT